MPSKKKGFIYYVWSRLRYEIKKVMSHVYLEDLDDAIETAIQFEMFVKFEAMYKSQAQR